MTSLDSPKTRLRPAPEASVAVSSVPELLAATDSVATDAGAIASDHDVGIGDVLSERYELQQQLGQGGMGVVFLAYDRIEEEAFAVKVLRPDFREHPEAIPALHEEVRKTRALAHPNIVGVYSLNRHAADLYVVMEYLQGRPLDRVIGEDYPHGMPFNRAWPLLKSAADALSYAHERGIIHSDLKPSNLFVTSSGGAKVLDFGIARAAHGEHLQRFDPARLEALTPAYASPEMQGGAAPDVRDDVYGFACVAYELLTGRHPFRGRSVAGAPDATQAVARIPPLTRAQYRALARAMCFEREARTASIAQFIGDLGGIWTGLRDTVTDDRWRKRWRHAAVPAIVTGIMLIAGSGLALHLWQERVDRQTLRAVRASWLNAGKSLQSLCRESHELAVKSRGLAILERSSQTPEIVDLTHRYQQRLAQMQANVDSYATSYNNDLRQLARFKPKFIAAAHRSISESSAAPLASAIVALIESDIQRARTSGTKLDRAALSGRCAPAGNGGGSGG